MQRIFDDEFIPTDEDRVSLWDSEERFGCFTGPDSDYVELEEHISKVADNGLQGLNAENIQGNATSTSNRHTLCKAERNLVTWFQARMHWIFYIP